MHCIRAPSKQGRYDWKSIPDARDISPDLVAINAINAAINGQDKQRPDVSDQCVYVPSWEQIKIHGDVKHWSRIDAHHVLVEMYRIFNILCHNP